MKFHERSELHEQSEMAGTKSIQIGYDGEKSITNANIIGNYNCMWIRVRDNPNHFEYILGGRWKTENDITKIKFVELEDEEGWAITLNNKFIYKQKNIITVDLIIDESANVKEINV